MAGIDPYVSTQWHLVPGRTAVVVIDPQNDFLHLEGWYAKSGVDIKPLMLDGRVRISDDLSRGALAIAAPQWARLAEVRKGSCVTSIAGPHGDAQLYWR